MLGGKIKLNNGDLRLGEISGIHGVQGWVKIFSDTQPRENIFDYQPWFLCREGCRKTIEVLNWRKQGKTLVAHLQGIDDRDQARDLVGSVIAINEKSLPSLDNGEFYWSQLIGLRVTTLVADQKVDLGLVDRLIETGANDVLVVVGDDQSLDQAERLIPWVPDQVVINIDLNAQVVEVDWDPDF